MLSKIHARLAVTLPVTQPFLNTSYFNYCSQCSSTFIYESHKHTEHHSHVQKGQTENVISFWNLAAILLWVAENWSLPL